MLYASKAIVILWRYSYNDWKRCVYWWQAGPRLSVCLRLPSCTEDLTRHGHSKPSGPAVTIVTGPIMVMSGADVFICCSPGAYSKAFRWFQKSWRYWWSGFWCLLHTHFPNCWTGWFVSKVVSTCTRVNGERHPLHRWVTHWMWVVMTESMNYLSFHSFKFYQLNCVFFFCILTGDILSLWAMTTDSHSAKVMNSTTMSICLAMHTKWQVYS